MSFQALLFCPDEKTARVTTQVLTELEFGVEACSEPFAAVKKLMGQHFDAVVVDCENEQNATLLFKSARNSNSNQGALAVAVVEGQAGVASAFRIGANLVLTKPINVEQAKSTLRVARGLLRKGTEAAKPGTPATSASSAPSAATTPIPEATRPAPTQPAASSAVAPPAPKPVAPVFKTVPQTQAAVAKKSVEPAVAASWPSAPATGTPSAPSQESPSAAAPSSSAEPKQPVQAVAKPSLSATASGKNPIVETQDLFAAPSASSTGKVPIFQGKPVLRSGIGVGGGLASAPAPAKEAQVRPSVDSPAEPPVETEVKKTRKPAVDDLFAAPAPVPAKTAPIAAPSFAALGSDTDSESGRSSKIIVIVIVALILATAGYFGYTKFFAARNAGPASAPAAPQTQPASPESQLLTSVDNNNSVASTTPSAAPAPVEHAAPAVHSSSIPKDTSSDSEPEVVVRHPDEEKPLTVKTDVTHHAKVGQQSASSEITAPPVLGTGPSAEPAALSTIVQSAPVAMPKVAAPETLKVSQGVTEGLLIKKVPPVYPRQAIQMHVQGAVLLQAMIDRQGRISSVKVLKGDAILARAAVEAVNQWRYKPYFLDGQPVDIQTQITVNFKLP